MKYSLLIIGLLLITIPIIEVKGQNYSEEKTIKLLCQHWHIDSLLVKDLNKKFAPPDNIIDNYIELKKDGTFESQEMGIKLTGKWEFDYDKMQIKNFDFDHPDLPEEIVFDIVKLDDSELAITSKPMSGGQITMFYKSKKE